MNEALHLKEQALEKQTGNSFLYLLFSFFSGVLETGILTGGLMLFGITGALLLVLAYQIGCLARNPLNLSLRGAICALCTAIPLFLISDNNIRLLLLATLVLSSGLQSAREWLLPEQNLVSLSTKRLTRVSGFIFGVLGCYSFGFNLLACIAIMALFALLPLAVRQKKAAPFINLNKNVKSNCYSWIMLFHQTHYFAYAYVLLAFFLSLQNQIFEQHVYWRPLIAAAGFAMGWYSYISGKWLLKKILKLSALQAAIAGHVWVVICLTFMVLLNGYPFLIGLTWVLGGFGGGSVYAIKDLAKRNSNKADLELWEHWGHMTGVSASFLSVQFLPSYPMAPFVLAIMAALSTLILLHYSANTESTG